MGDNENAKDSPLAILQEDCLHHILSFLKGKDLKVSRTVSRFWNSVASPQIPKVLKIITQEMKKQSDASTQAPQLQLPAEYFNFVDYTQPAPVCVASFHRLLKPSSTEFIRIVNVVDGEQTEGLILAINNGELPNLEEIYVAWNPVFASSLREEIDFKFHATCNPSSLPKLRKLALDIHWTDQATTKFYQSVIDAAPNLFSFEALRPFDLSKLLGLRRLTFNKRRGGASTPTASNTETCMLEAVSRYLHFLSLRGLRFQDQEASLSFPEVTELHLNFVVWEPAPKSFASWFPKLEKFKGDYSGIRQYCLGGKQPTLNRLEINVACYVFEFYHTHRWQADFLVALAESVPNLKVLKLLAKCAYDCKFTHMGEDWAEMLTDIANWGSGDLILKAQDPLTISHVIECFNERDKFCRVLVQEGERVGGTFVFENFRERDKFAIAVHEDSDQVIENFGATMQKLLRKWRRIEFRGFEASESHMRMIREQILRNSLPVEIYGQHSP